MSLYKQIVKYVTSPFKSYLPIDKKPPTIAINKGDQSSFFSSIVTVARNVLISPDISIRENRELSEQMIHDPVIMAPLTKRMLATAQLDWQIVPEDEKDKRQKFIAKKVEEIIRRTPYQTEVFRQLLWAIWRGTSVIELRWVQCPKTNTWYIAKFRSHNGDKIFYDLWGNPRIQTMEFQTGGRELTK